MKHIPLPCAALALLLVLVGCGSGYTYGVGTVTVVGLAPGQALVCGGSSATVQFAGSGFLSEHGTDVVVRWTALQGTPLQGGTSASEETPGTVLSDSLFEAQIPQAFGTFPGTVTVILPGGNEGTSPELTLEIGGDVFGPYAYSDTYLAVGNVPLVVDAAGGVLPNDEDSFCGEGEPQKIGAGGSRQAVNVTVVAYDATSTLGGSVVMGADGSFTYTPPLGAQTLAGDAFDSFTYTIEEPGRPTSSATVFIDICDVVWFIDNSAAPGGDGSFLAPFDSTTAFNAQQFAGQSDDPEEGDWVFIYRGNSGVTPYDDGIVLKNDQKLVGQGVDLVVCGQLLVQATMAPVLTNSGISIGEAQGGPVVNLANRNVVRGVETDGGANGILGFFVSGPTVIESVTVRSCNGSGILLQNCSGDFQIGDPAAQAPDDVRVDGAGWHGIEIGGFGQIPVLRGTPTAITADGPGVSVDRTTIVSCQGDGIYCIDANLDCEFVTTSAVSTGVNFETRGFGPPCSVSLVNSNIGIPVPCRFRGVSLYTEGAPIDAFVGFNSVWSADNGLLAESESGEPVVLALDFNDFHAGSDTDVLAAVYSVNLLGYEGGVVVTSMQGNAIYEGGNGITAGIRALGCLFDANPADMAPDAVPGGTLVCGGGAANRIQGTSLRLEFCFGDLGIDTFTVFQQGGDPSGVENLGGGVNLTITTSTVDHVP